ncbi:mCG1042841 [Mus musculus]|nr:mCG1042841 [Mus musculus]
MFEDGGLIPCVAGESPMMKLSKIMIAS